MIETDSVLKRLFEIGENESQQIIVNVQITFYFLFHDFVALSAADIVTSLLPISLTKRQWLFVMFYFQNEIDKLTAVNAQNDYPLLIRLGA